MTPATRCGLFAFVIVILTLAIAQLGADSVTTVDRLSVFGRVVTMNATTLVLHARFPSTNAAAPIEERDLTIARSSVVQLEFNRTTFNPGGPPAVGLRASDRKSAKTAEAVGKDVVVLIGGERAECNASVTVDHDVILCGARTFDRRQVVRILMQGGR